MLLFSRIHEPRSFSPSPKPISARPAFALLLFLVAAASAAHGQSGSPFDTGFTAIQTVFTGTVAKVASLVAILIGGYVYVARSGLERGWFDVAV
jgi:type IV secretory pathway VirB2 component (pilin)